MSTPIRNPDGVNDPMSYAPRWARHSPPVVPELPARAPAAQRKITAPKIMAPKFAHAPPTAPGGTDASSAAPGFIDAPPMAPGIGGPNIHQPPHPPAPFAGDVAIKDLRRRLSLDPDLVPQPPIHARRESVIPWIARLSFVLILAATVAFGITLMTLPNKMPKEATKQAGEVAGVVTPLLDGLSRAGTQAQSARLVVEEHKAFANEPIPLGVSLNGGSGAEMLTLVGLASGTKLSAGAPRGPTGWQLSAREIAKAFAYAPRDFVGVMDAAIDLRSPSDRLVDSQVVRLEWIQKKEGRWPLQSEAPKPEPSKPPPVVAQLDSEEIVTLIKRGEDFLKHGDVASARLFLRRAASAGSAQAALALGVTFDPAFLSEQGVLGFAPDPAQARAWYEKAAQLGSSDASRRLERLAGGAQ
jgi:hypothetical protein